MLETFLNELGNGFDSSLAQPRRLMDDAGGNALHTLGSRSGRFANALNRGPRRCC